MPIVVRNDGGRTVPDLAVTVNGFTYTRPQPGLADPRRPVWIIDRGPGLQNSQSVEGNFSPGGAVTAYTNTWALGSLSPGATATFVWHVTAMVPGPHTITYRVAAGLNGKARAQLLGGGIPQGLFQVNISRQAPQSRVDPNTGRVIRSPPPVPRGKKNRAPPPPPPPSRA